MISRSASGWPCKNSAPNSTAWPVGGSRTVCTRPPSRDRASSTTTLRPAWASRRAAARPATPPPTTITSLVKVPGLFVSEGYDGIEPRGASSRPQPEEEADGGAEPKRQRNRGGRDQGVPLHDLRQCDRGADAEQDTQHSSQQAEGQRFDQELHQDIHPGGAESFTNADLTGALGDRDQHDIHDPDAAHQEADRSNAGEQAGEYLSGLLLG